MGCYDYSIHLRDHEGVYICQNCGLVHAAYTDDNTTFQQSFGSSMAQNHKQDLPRNYSINIYKRVTHFRYWLYRLQGKEQHRLTTREFNEIANAIVKWNIKVLDHEVLRFILRRLKFQRFYNNTYTILKHFTGHALFELTLNQERLLIKLFIKIQLCYMKCHGTRVNMLTYLYVIRKLCELLGWLKLTKSIPTLKSTSKVYQQDCTWKEICNEIGIRFIPTL